MKEVFRGIIYPYKETSVEVGGLNRNPCSAEMMWVVGRSSELLWAQGEVFQVIG